MKARNGTVFESPAAVMLAVMVPKRIAREINQFLVDSKTGNVRINIKDGRILGAQLEQIVRSDA